MPTLIQIINEAKKDGSREKYSSKKFLNKKTNTKQ